MAKKASSKKSAKTAAKGKAASVRSSKTAKKTAKPAARKATKKATTKTASKRKITSRLSKAQLDEFRRILLQKRRDLIGDLSGIEAEALGKNRHSNSDLSRLPTHPADVGTDNFEQEFTLGLLESERILLAKIDAALERIDNRTYGICLGTGKQIGIARLRARPWTRYCIEYARALETGAVKLPEPSRSYSGIDGDLEDDRDEPVDMDDDDDDSPL